MGFWKSTQFILWILGTHGRFKCFHYISWSLPSNEKYFKICIHVTLHFKDYFICPLGTWILNSFRRWDTPLNLEAPVCFRALLGLICLQISSYQLQPVHDTKLWKILISHIYYLLFQASFEKHWKQHKVAKTLFIDFTTFCYNIKVPLQFYIIQNWSYKIVEWIVP